MPIPAAARWTRWLERRLDLKIGPRADERADTRSRLNERLRPEIDRRGLRKLYEEIELPLARVLARMECTGIRVEPEALDRLSDAMETEIARLTAEIHGLAGSEFNITSPQQLGQGAVRGSEAAGPGRYGKGKEISTAADVLEALAPDHEIVRKVLEYRQLTKLKGTYVGRAARADRSGHRPHPHQLQPGRRGHRAALLLESQPAEHPDPDRTGPRDPRGLRAARGWKLVVADYSQIELRLLAHMSRDPVLLDAFRRGEDIHTRTAAEVFGVPP